MHNPEEIKSFCLKSCNFRPSFNLFVNVTQYARPDLPYGTVPEQRAQMVRLFFGLHLHIWQEDVEKISKVPKGPAQCKSSSGNNMASKRNHHSIVPFFNNHSPPPRQFLRNKILLRKQIAMKNAR